MTIMSGDVN